MTRTILHVDMDAFFASVEQHDHPEWRGRPVIVGSPPDARGVVSTCSYEARRFGVHSAMPSRTAYQRCPDAIFVRPRLHRYQDVSDAAFEVFSHYSPYVEGVSIDEAFLDISGSIHLYGSPRALGEALRREVQAVCGVTCSVGIAPNRLLAKIGSEEQKPNGLTVMPFDPHAIAAFLATKPLSVLWGVGSKTRELLRPHGIITCGDVQRLNAQILEPILGLAAATTLTEAAFGICTDKVYWEAEAEKSVSREYTFDQDETNRAHVREKLIELITDVGRRFRREKRWARTVKIKLRDAQFNTLTRQTSLPAPACDDITFRTAALDLFDQEPIHAVRLIGFGVANIQDEPDEKEPRLFADPEDEARKRRERLSAALDDLRDRGLM